MPNPETDPAADPSPSPADAEANHSGPAADLVARPHAMLRYTTLRLGLFIVALLLLWLVGIRSGVWLVALALVLSGLASYVLLARQRDAMSAQIHAAQQRRRAGALASVSREDRDDSPDAAGGTDVPDAPPHARDSASGS